MRATLAPEALSAGFELTRESWQHVWPEARLLAEQHSAELGLPPLDIDEKLMGGACDAGALHIFGARQGGELVGYICWSVGRHPEMKGKIMAEQGPWFALPGHLAGRDLFLFSLEELRQLGVHVVYPHHRWNDRGGKHLERFFTSLGARALDIRYELKLRIP